MMTPIPIDGPAVEPVGMPDMRTYLRLDDGVEDDLIAALVKTARVHVEAAAGRVLVESRWRMGLEAWPEGRVVPLPVSPLIAVERVRVFGRDGGAIDVPAGLYEADLFSDPPRLVVDPLAPEPGRRRQGVLTTARRPRACQRRCAKPSGSSSRAGSRTGATPTQARSHRTFWRSSLRSGGCGFRRASAPPG